jgi:UDP-N-acetylmuramate: L-alanyl-gamma-D-glutamyl-meso-diaminopimelate ligase
MKWIHVIGICGKTTANVAKMFKGMGWFVTGSDAQFFPPAYNIILENQILHAEGYHFKHLTKAFWEDLNAQTYEIRDIPDLVMIVDSVSTKNKEYLFAKNKAIPVKTFSQIFHEFVAKSESIVVVGTAGKTTTTALITKLLKESNLNPTYMIGADVKDFKDSLQYTDSQWSVLEGDEYYGVDLSKELRSGPKFLEYKPKYLIITNIGYEHQDVYPTQEEYTNAFKSCVNLVPEDGLIIARAEDQQIEIAVSESKARVIRYKFINSLTQINPDDPEIFYIARASHSFDILNNQLDVLLTGETSLLGTYNLENILAAYLVCKFTNIHSSIPDNEFKQIVKYFQGPHKRLEVLLKSSEHIVIDDFAVAPNRVLNSLQTIKEEFKTIPHEIICIFEPNSASRPADGSTFKTMYAEAFKYANTLILPEFSDFNSDLVSAEQAAQWLIELYPELEIKVKKSEEMLGYLKEYLGEVSKKDIYKIIIFMSSYRLTETAKSLADSVEVS